MLLEGVPGRDREMKDAFDTERVRWIKVLKDAALEGNEGVCAKGAVGKDGAAAVGTHRAACHHRQSDNSPQVHISPYIAPFCPCRHA